MGGMAAEEPVAITQYLAERRFPSRLIACSSTKEASPYSTFAPRLQNLSSESYFWIDAYY